MIPPRYYQQEAHDAVIGFARKTTMACLVEAATGAGKSLLVAMLATTFYRLSGGKSILCLQPSAKLLKQNREKFLTTGQPASVFSASAGNKCLRHPVVFGTPISVSNGLKRFTGKICAVILDECHLLTPTIKKIVEHLRELNPGLRVIGLTATPFRRGEGYIYELNPDGSPVPDDQVKAPYFKQCVYQIKKRQLEEEGYLTPARLADIHAERYDLSGLPRKVVGEKELDKVYLGQSRETALICADFVDQCRDRKAVMIFAATVRHAKEVAASLPTHLTRVIGGTENMDPKPREKLEEDFTAGRFKYLVSVGTMTTGVDFPMVDAIVIMRRTESLNLLEQIIGRGSRLYPGKTDFLLFDYCDNLEFHYGEDVELYDGVVQAPGEGEKHGYVPSLCTSCGTVNNFAARPNPDGLGYDEEGYFTDLSGTRIETEHGPTPGHFGRRCRGQLRVGNVWEQCAHRWTDKQCADCGASNDIAARYCAECKAELVDPNEKLVLEFRKRKKDATQVQVDRVLEIIETSSQSKEGESIRVHVVTEYRKFDFWLFPNSNRKWLVGKYEQYINAKPIQTITYRKNPDSKFYEVHDYNRPEDTLP